MEETKNEGGQRETFHRGSPAVHGCLGKQGSRSEFSWFNPTTAKISSAFCEALWMGVMLVLLLSMERRARGTGRDRDTSQYRIASLAHQRQLPIVLTQPQFATCGTWAASFSPHAPSRPQGKTRIHHCAPKEKHTHTHTLTHTHKNKKRILTKLISIPFCREPTGE